MEIGDLFYIIILTLFMILGFFNDSKKKKNEQKQQPEPKYRSFEMGEMEEEIPPFYNKKPPLPLKDLAKNKYSEKEISKYHSKEGRVVFQSSMGLVTDFKKESSLGSSFTTTNTDYIYQQREDSQETITSNTKDRLMHHSIINDLSGENRKSELIKGIIYNEILKRRY